jgi:hypothetical protein
MRSSEEMAMVLYRAWAGYNKHADVSLVTWEDIGEYAQELYLSQVNALLEHLFEHGRISQYLNVEQLEEFKKEYGAYLASKDGTHHV